MENGVRLPLGFVTRIRDRCFVPGALPEILSHFIRASRPGSMLFLLNASHNDGYILPHVT